MLGVGVSAINMSDARSVIEEAIARKSKIYICVCPVSTIMECQSSVLARTSVNSADLVTPDGMPVVWLGRLLGNAAIRRVYGPDLMLEACAISESRGYKNYFYGSDGRVLEALQKKLKNRFPNLIIAGTYSPPFGELSEEEDARIVEMINSAGPDILWVGLGSPKQDIWMYEHKARINAPVMIGVGAAFDFVAGTKKQAPKWMQRSGFEWLFRLSIEPKRLFKRYIFGNALFLYLICAQAIRSIFVDKDE